MYFIRYFASDRERQFRCCNKGQRKVYPSRSSQSFGMLIARSFCKLVTLLIPPNHRSDLNLHDIQSEHDSATLLRSTGKIPELAVLRPLLSGGVAISPIHRGDSNPGLASSSDCIRPCGQGAGKNCEIGK